MVLVFGSLRFGASVELAELNEAAICFR